MQDKQFLYRYTLFFVLYEVSTYLANDLIMPGMVKVVKEFNAPMEYAATSLTYFILGGCFLPIILNLWIEKIGSRKILLFGNGLFLLATFSITLTGNINQFLWARLFQGMGLGFIFIGYATIHRLFDDIRAIKIITLLNNISIIAPLLGPIIGGAITSSYNWRWTFILVGILGSISIYGLYKYMPNIDLNYKSNKGVNNFNNYFRILQNKLFLIGALIIGINGVVTIAWIGISPVIIFVTNKSSFTNYATYQIMVFSGTLLSSIIMQFVAKNLDAFKLIRFGSLCAIVGLSFSFIFSFENKILCVFGLFIFTLGSGLYISVIIRILISSINYATSAITALTSLFNALFGAIGLEITNFVCGKINYSFPTLTLFNLLLGIICFSLTRYLLVMVKDYKWQ